jgi:hypothetical protein
MLPTIAAATGAGSVPTSANIRSVSCLVSRPNPGFQIFRNVSPCTEKTVLNLPLSRHELSGSSTARFGLVQTGTAPMLARVPMQSLCECNGETTHASRRLAWCWPSCATIQAEWGDCACTSTGQPVPPPPPPPSPPSPEPSPPSPEPPSPPSPSPPPSCVKFSSTAARPSTPYLPTAATERITRQPQTFPSNPCLPVTPLPPLSWACTFVVGLHLCRGLPPLSWACTFVVGLQPGPAHKRSIIILRVEISQTTTVVSAVRQHKHTMPPSILWGIASLTLVTCVSAAGLRCYSREECC